MAPLAQSIKTAWYILWQPSLQDASKGKNFSLCWWKELVLLTHTLVPLIVLQVALRTAAPVSTHQVLTAMLTPVVTVTLIHICQGQIHSKDCCKSLSSVMNNQILGLVIVFEPSQVCALGSSENPRWQSQLKLPGVFWQTPLEPHRLGSDAHSLLSTQRRQSRQG